MKRLLLTSLLMLQRNPFPGLKEPVQVYTAHAKEFATSYCKQYHDNPKEELRCQEGFYKGAEWQANHTMGAVK